jgi:hypothetical protein
MKRGSLIFVLAILLFPYHTVFSQEMEVSPKMEIILVQDESGSMEKTDPQGVRVLASSILSENLMLAGEGNTLGFLIFASYVTSVIPPTDNFAQIIKASSETPVSRAQGAEYYFTLETTPFRMYTDFFTAISEAKDILSKTPDSINLGGTEYPKNKIIILLTDGKIDPWPGAPRFGNISTQYLELIKNYPPGQQRYDAGREFLPKLQEVDRERINNEILNPLREKGWKIYAIGFSNEVDREFLTFLAHQTGGEAGIAPSYRELKDILESILPRSEKIVIIPAQEFCNVKDVERTINIPSSIKKLLFKIDLTKMVERGPSLTQENLSFTIRSPQGTVYTHNDQGVIWTKNKKGRIFSVSYKIDNPPAGNWRITAHSNITLCGNIKLMGEREQKLRIELDPSAENYPLGATVDIITYLEGEKGEILPTNEARGEVLYDGTSYTTLTFSPQEGKWRSHIKFDRAGEYLIKIRLRDSQYNTEIKSEKKVKVGGECALYAVIERGEYIDLGILSPTNKTLTSPLIEVRTNCSSIPVKVRAPLLQTAMSTIPTNWISITPSEGYTSQEMPFRFSFRITLPEQVPPEIEEGRYQGSLRITSPLASAPAEVMVRLDFSPPFISIVPDKLYFNFWWRIGKPSFKEIKISSNQSTKVYLQLPPSVRRISDEKTDERIIVRIKGIEKRENMFTAEVSAGEETSIGIYVDLNDEYVKKKKEINEGTRIPPGIYKGEIYIRGNIGKEKKIPITISIPKTPAVIIVRKVVFGALFVIGFFFLISLIISIMRIKEEGEKSEEGEESEKRPWPAFFAFWLLLCAVIYIVLRKMI